MKRKGKHAPKVLFAIILRNGELFGAFATQEEAEDDCWGPVTRDARILHYEKVKVAKKIKKPKKRPARTQ